MPMNAVLLAQEMKAAVDAVAGQYQNGETPNTAALEALASAIITHIQTNATVPVTGGSSAGVYPVV